MTNRTYLVAERPNVRLLIQYDPTAENPREMGDMLGHMVCWHRRYKLGDEQPTIEAKRWRHEFERGKRPQDYVILPLYLYDHSGVTMNTTGFACPWDSGQVGWIIATREQAKKIGAPWENVEDQLRQEVAVYDQYLQGEVFGFMVERRQACGHWEQEDSCWGFYGSDFRQNGLLESVPDDVKEMVP